MNTFSDTESEFWRDIDKPVTIENLGKPKEHLETSIKAYESSIQNVHHKEKFQKLINQARNAAKEVYHNKLKVGLHKQAKEYQAKISEIDRMHKEEITELIKKFWKLDDVLVTRDNQIQELQRFFIKQEEDIANFRIKENFKEKIKEEVSSNELWLENKALQMQVESFKELIQIYEKDLYNLKAKLKKTEDICEENNENFIKEKEELRRKIERSDEEYKKKIQDVNYKYIDFKNDIKTELEVRHVINYRQQEIISSLKDDLATAKVVLDTPRLLF